MLGFVRPLLVSGNQRNVDWCGHDHDCLQRICKSLGRTQPEPLENYVRTRLNALIHGSHLKLAVLAWALGCDGYIQVDGQVYALPAGDMGASVAYIDDSIPDTLGLVPPDSAAIWLFHRPSDTSLVGEGRLPLWVNADTTDHQGRFSVGSATAPRRFTALLRVRRAGYQELDVPFLHDTSSHHAVVLLVPREATAP